MAEKKIAQAKKDQACLEHEIERLRDLQARAGGVIHFYGTLFAPVRRVPPETLSHIFSFCIWSGRFDEYDFDDQEPALIFSNISRVCKNWRRVIISSPRLWSKLPVDRRKKPNPRQQITNHLKYSCGCPLTILVRGGFGDLHEEAGLWDLMLAEANRIEYLSAETAPEILRFVELRLPDGWPQLKQLEIRDIRRPDLAVRAFGASPQLADLTLTTLLNSRRFSEERLLLDSILWQRLTRVSIHLPVAMIIPVLNAMPNLKTCKISCQERDAEETSSPTPNRVNVPLCLQLSSFHLEVMEPDDTVILDKLVAPCLKEISLSSYRSCGQSVPNLSPLPDFLRRSACSIRKASLTIDHASLPGALDIFKPYPGLTDLSVDYYVHRGQDGADLDPLFSCLAHKLDHPEDTMLPRLQTIEISSFCTEFFRLSEPRKYPFTSDILADMLLSRHQAPKDHGISVPAVLFDPDWVQTSYHGISHMDKLNEVKALGMKIDFPSPKPKPKPERRGFDWDRYWD